MTGKTDWELEERIDGIFDDIVAPVFGELIEEYDGAGGYGAKYVTDSPLITGLGRYASIMITHPGGVEMIICVYWVRGSLRLVAENIRMVTLSKTFDIFTVTKELLSKQVRFLSGLEA
jgi:hypothetical protein